MEKPTFTPPTEKQIAEYEAKMSEHYDTKLPFLRKKHEYDTLQADIAEARVRTLIANNQFARAQMEAQKQEEDAQKEKKEA